MSVIYIKIMEQFVLYECRKFKDQALNWLNAFYSTSIYYYNVIDNGNELMIKIRLTVPHNFYIKRLNGIVSYITKTFRYPQYIRVNYRYVKNFFDLTIICGRKNDDIYLSENEK